MTLSDSVKQLVVPVVVAAVTSLGGLLYTADTQRVLLQQNIEVTKELSKVVTDLRIEVAKDRGKYVTRDELRAELKEIRRGS